MFDLRAASVPRCCRRPRRSTLLLLGLALVGLGLAGACSGKHGSTDTPAAGTKLILERVTFGRLVDVYGLQADEAGEAIALFRRDVVIGGDIEDQRPPESDVSDAEILFDFFGNDPDTLQPRLLIPRRLDSEQFRAAFAQLDDNLREVTPKRTGEGSPGDPFSVVPRNAALRLQMSDALPIGDDFFVERDAAGMVTGLRNTEAVQLLRIVGDVDQPNAFVPLAVRVVVQQDALILDPVLLGNEGLQYQTTNIPEGLPESADQVGGNIRIALALDGPLALPGMRAAERDLTGKNNRGFAAVVRDFRSGNANDDSFELAGGFVRDSLPLRLVTEIPMYLERVEAVTGSTQEVTLWKGGAVHEIDRGDVLRFLGDDGATVFGSSEVVVDPVDDAGAPAVAHVRVRIRRIPGLDTLDPRHRPGYPEPQAEREAWLLANAPLVFCVAEFTAGGEEPRDDPRNFVRFSPSPLPLGGIQPPPDEFVSPFAGAVVHFNKPVNLATVRWADTFFFAMRDLTSAANIETFQQTLRNAGGGLGIEPSSFGVAKYRTPWLIAARVFDEDGSRTTLRLQPATGFYLDDTMRNPPAGADHRYFLHLIADSPDGGIRDLAGNRLDLRGTTAQRANSVVIPFTLDTRANGNEPMFPDNLTVSIVRRFAARDEDANPSYFRPEEVPAPGQSQPAAAYPLEDVFGAAVYVDGRLQARPTTRSRIVVDNFSQSGAVQQPPPGLPQSPLAWCPQTVFHIDPTQTENQRAANTANNLVQVPIQNPLNPFGARLQTLWREIDMSLSRTDPFDFNLDIEGMYWAPWIGTDLQYDRFDDVSLWLGHSEYRPAPCVGDFSALPSLPNSGLRPAFAGNYLANPKPTGSGNEIESAAPKRQCYENAQLLISSALVIQPGGQNRFLPLPTFQKPYFVFRDETVAEQGGNAGIGSDLTPSPGNPSTTSYAPYIVSPFAQGQGRRRLDLGAAGGIATVSSYWNDAPNFRLDAQATADPFTGGLVGAIALPLLADFWTTCDRSDLPLEDPFVASGLNGWQTAVTVQSNLRPNFRVFSGGRPAGAPQGGLCVSSGDPGWTIAAGGWAPGLTPTAPWVVTPNDPQKGDNTLYWIMLDVLRRQTVITSGFVDLLDPHRVPTGFADPRLGPFYLQNGVNVSPANVLPVFVHEFDPPLSRLPGGTSLVAQFRGASNVDPSPWYWNAWINTPNVLFPAATLTNPLYSAAMRQDLRPTAANFPLDPFKAGDAHIRKWDTRGGRNNWTYLYNRTVTRYVEDANDLMAPDFADQYSAPGDPFTPHNIRYVNWRFLMGNNTEVTPPVAPQIDTFALSYRFTRH